MVNCESCGIPMRIPEDYGGEDLNNKYCKYCAPDGNLKSRGEVREGWINAAMRMEEISREEAEKKVDAVMPRMPAWRE